MELKLDNYGQIISDDKLGENILDQIKSLLKKHEVVTVNFVNIKSMATYNAKQIFGQLYLDLGPALFFKRIAIKNASDNILTIIKMGIQDSLQTRAHTEAA